MEMICHNGKFLPAEEPVLTGNNKSFQWGEGLFETMKLCHGKLLLESFHLERLLAGCEVLQFKMREEKFKEISDCIIRLAEKNNCIDLGRVRLALYRGNDDVSFLIQAWSLGHEFNRFNERGLTTGLYPHVKKSIDDLSNLKTASYLPYAMAARFAKENNLDDAIVLNSANHVCDTSKANIFIVSGGKISTPALTEGCIAGVMRRFLIETLSRQGVSIQETVITETDLLKADEIFLTNAIHGIRWVGQYENRSLSNAVSKQLYERLIAPLFSY